MVPEQLLIFIAESRIAEYVSNAAATRYLISVSKLYWVTPTI